MPRRRQGDFERRCRALLLAFVLPSGACFEYATTPITSPPTAGHNVRLDLTPNGFDRLAEALGSDFPHSGRRIDGELLEASPGQFLVALRVWSGGAGEANQLQQRLAIPIQDVVGLQVKTLDKRRTAYVALGATAVLATLVARRAGGTFGGTTTSTGQATALNPAIGVGSYTTCFRLGLPMFW